jgi:hypothetical protein
MRVSAGGCYEIAGTTLQRVEVGAQAENTIAKWLERRTDLLIESLAIGHVHHTLTAEENALWNAIQRELDTAREVVARLEREAKSATR